MAASARISIVELDQSEPALTLAKRLFIAFLLIVAVGVACWVVLPRYGLDVPPIAVMLAYIVILAACLLAAAPDDDDKDQNSEPGNSDPIDAIYTRPRPDEGPIAGRIGPRSG